MNYVQCYYFSLSVFYATVICVWIINQGSKSKFVKYANIEAVGINTSISEISLKLMNNWNTMLKKYYNNYEIKHISIRIKDLSFK